MSDLHFPAHFLSAPACMFYILKQTCAHILILVGLVWPASLRAQQRDTLDAVKVYSKETTDGTKTRVPVQQLNKQELGTLNSISVADAVKYFSGVLVKDYGGIGGLKTISVRSLGANHTGIMYDGIMMGDAQVGQIDLGRLSLDNIESIQLSINGPQKILQPARAYASAAVLSISSGSAAVTGISAQVKLKAGSFGFFNPSFTVKDKAGNRFGQVLNMEYQRAKGDYPYKNYVSGMADSRRMNADLKSLRAEYDAAFTVSDSNAVKLKLYYFNSERGLPGAIILYNNFSGQRLNNEQFFAQANWQKTMSQKSRLLLNAKFTKDYKYYIDPYYQNSVGKLENEFHQQEWYFSAAYQYKFSKHFSVAYSSDYFKSTLIRKDSFAVGFANPNRDNYLNNVAVEYSTGNFTGSGNLLNTIIREAVKNGAPGKKLDKLTPAVAASFHLSKVSPVQVRAAYKRIFRAPTFDDLYFTNVGNTALRPELGDQYNIGITFSDRIRIADRVQITADAYYNSVKDKILAVPREDLFQWTMLNIASASIKGVDATISIEWKKWKSILFTTRLSYSYQDARDMSDAQSASYRNQLAYTPKHSGAAGFGMEYRRFTFNYNSILSSYRYRLGDQTSENLVKEWATHDVSLGYTILTKKTGSYRVLGELNNVLNSQYEVIRFYPMPRFNYRIGIISTFN